MVFCRLCIIRLRFSKLCNDMPEVLVCIINKLEVSSGFFAIPSRNFWVVLVWMEFAGSSMYLLLTCVSDTSSLKENPKMPKESLRCTPTPSGSYSLLFRRGGGR